MKRITAYFGCLLCVLWMQSSVEAMLPHSPFSLKRAVKKEHTPSPLLREHTSLMSSSSSHIPVPIRTLPNGSRQAGVVSSSHSVSSTSPVPSLNLSRVPERTGGYRSETYVSQRRSAPQSDSPRSKRSHSSRNHSPRSDSDLDDVEMQISPRRGPVSSGELVRQETKVISLNPRIEMITMTQLPNPPRTGRLGSTTNPIRGDFFVEEVKNFKF